jgi:hypothetical protein
MQTKVLYICGSQNRNFRLQCCLSIVTQQSILGYSYSRLYYNSLLRPRDRIFSSNDISVWLQLWILLLRLYIQSSQISQAVNILYCFVTVFHKCKENVMQKKGWHKKHITIRLLELLKVWYAPVRCTCMWAKTGNSSNRKHILFMAIIEMNDAVLWIRLNMCIFPKFIHGNDVRYGKCLRHKS